MSTFQLKAFHLSRLQSVCKNVRELCCILCLAIYCMPVLGAETLDFECVDDVAVSSKKNQYLDDKLYAETIQYLRGFISILNTHNTACDSRAAMLKESRPLGEKSCLNQEEDVVQLIEQSQIILDNPEKFRACFDAQRDYKGKNKLYTPNALLQKASSVSISINRPLLLSLIHI